MKASLRIGACVFAVLLASTPSMPWAASAPSTASSSTITKGDSGTTIIGDQDAAVGLYLTPWKDESAADIDRAPGLLDQQPAPSDPLAFKRQIENDDAIASYRRAHLEQNR